MEMLLPFTNPDTKLHPVFKVVLKHVDCPHFKHALCHMWTQIQNNAQLHQQRGSHARLPQIEIEITSRKPQILDYRIDAEITPQR